MKSRKATDFEAWADLLIERKVPDRYKHLIRSDLIERGAAILKEGGAFEIQVQQESPADASLLVAKISIAPIPSRVFQTRP
jgi:hypothetical protein